MEDYSIKFQNLSNVSVSDKQLINHSFHKMFSVIGKNETKTKRHCKEELCFSLKSPYLLANWVDASIELFQTFAVFHTFRQIDYTYKN